MVMAKNGPILIVEDNPTDQQTLQVALALSCAGNELVLLNNADDALNFLRSSINDIPFLILCDVNLPKMDGIELKRKINKKFQPPISTIPFILYSALDSHYAVMEAYNNMTIQGYFQKNNALRELSEVLKTITDYWRLCKVPTYPDNENRIVPSHKK